MRKTPPGDRNELSLTDEEQGALRGELLHLNVLKEVFGPKGVKGLAAPCSECGRDHYLDWDLIADEIEHLLEYGWTRIHEPPHDPDPSRFVSWDYARGLLDGYTSAGDEELHQTSLRIILSRHAATARAE